MSYNINTVSGGSIELNLFNDRFHGQKLYMHVDQNSNINNGEGECSLVLTNDEVKNLISMLNGYLIFSEGLPYVVISENIEPKA